VVKQFISAELKPVAGTIEMAGMGAGQPGLPRQFRWGARQIQVVQVLRTWRETGSCRNGGGEQYVRKHCFEVLLDTEERAEIYFERQARSGKSRSRWWLRAIEQAAGFDKADSAGPAACKDRGFLA
jgi:hypothetical protein